MSESKGRLSKLGVHEIVAAGKFTIQNVDSFIKRLSRNQQQMVRTMQGMMIQNKKVCDKCKNEKYITETQKIEVEIPPGSPNGHKIRFYGEGEPISEGEPGDLEFQLM